MSQLGSDPFVGRSEIRGRGSVGGGASGAAVSPAPDATGYWLERRAGRGRFCSPYTWRL